MWILAWAGMTVGSPVPDVLGGEPGVAGEVLEAHAKAAVLLADAAAAT